MYPKFLINILLLFIATLVDAGDDCFEAKRPDELQQALDKQADKGWTKGHPTVVSLCKGTKVMFQKGDKSIEFPKKFRGEGENFSFVLKCEEPGTCVMDGGLLQKKERLFVGSGGFSTVSMQNGSLFIEGIVFQNFGVTLNGGVFLFTLSGNSSLYIYKCVFFENIAKGNVGGAVVLGGDSAWTVKMEAVHFKGNKCPNGFGGALYIGGEIGITIKKGIFNHNEAIYGGGITYYSDGFNKFDLEFVEFQHNKAEEGGGVALFGADSEWIDVKFNGNTARKIGEGYFQLGNSNLHGIENNFNKDGLESWTNTKRAYLVF